MYSNLTLSVIPVVSADWQLKDYLGTIKVRSSIGRNSYMVKPGLYQIGSPNSSSDVFVSANYKLSFDILRKNLSGINAWILVLDTKGVNVWCAAGKGTFGTDELIRQINQADLKNMLTHRRLILPQLGAPGVSAHLVKLSTGFNIEYGPVRASDIKEYLVNSYKKNDKLRTVNFNLKDRLLLIPVEIMNSLKQFIFISLFFIALSGITSSGYSFQNILEQGSEAFIYLLAAYLSGAALTPAFLPFLPFRSFAGKGMVAVTIIFILFLVTGFIGQYLLRPLGYFLISLAISSFLAMNFTGASTYTSLSGVKKEMKFFVPIQISLSVIGLILVIVSKFIYF
jgi:hypothetical protein